MDQVFSGTVLLPGEADNGLVAALELDGSSLRLSAGDDELGTWNRSTCTAHPSGRGSFQLDLGGEELVFTPSSPSAFAEAMTVPLTPESDEEPEESSTKVDYDAAIDEVIAMVTPRSGSNGDDEILSKPLLVSIVGVSAMLMAGLVAVSMAL